MARIIILNDITTWNGIGMSRYAGPYVIATRLRALGYDVRLIEWFTQHKDPLSLVEPFLTPDTVGVCLSTTFLTPDPYHDLTPEETGNKVDLAGRLAIGRIYKNPILWFQEPEQCADWFRSLRELLNRKSPGAKIVLGGDKVGYMFVYKEDRLAELLPEVDYALIGAADNTIVELFDDLNRGRDPYGTDRGGIRFIRPMANPTGCPDIVFDPVDQIQPNETLPIELKRGCAFNCKFCHYEKRGATMKNPDLLRDELVRNYERFGTTLYTFSDDCFNDTRANVETVCNVFAKLPFQIEWVSYARADLSIKFPDTLSAMVDTGARGLFFGIETFNHAAGRAAGKGVPPDKVKQWLLDTMDRYQSRMMIQCSFIAGLPHETDESMAETIEWLDQHRPMHLFTISPLGLYEYHEDLDESAVDYSDYARNPGKYGLEEVRHHPDVYWRHATMDLPRAREWAAIANRKWFAPHQPKPIIRTLWRYPVYRSLGLTHDEIIAEMTEPDGWSRNADVRIRWDAFVQKYWSELVKSASS